MKLLTATTSRYASTMFCEWMNKPMNEYSPLPVTLDDSDFGSFFLFDSRFADNINHVK